MMDRDIVEPLSDVEGSTDDGGDAAAAAATWSLSSSYGVATSSSSLDEELPSLTTLGADSDSSWDSYTEEEEGSASWIGNTVVDGRWGRRWLHQWMDFLTRKLLDSGQQYPIRSIALTVLVVLVIHYRVELKQFWLFHRDETSLRRTLASAADELREIVHGCYVMLIVTPIRYVENRCQQLRQNVTQGRNRVRQYLFPQPMPDFAWDDEYDENGNPKVVEPDPAVGPNEGRWDDPQFLAPAFETREEYPPDWKVYHQELGVVLKTEAEEYDMLIKKLQEQKELLRQEGIYDDTFSKDGEQEKFVDDRKVEATKATPRSGASN